MRLESTTPILRIVDEGIASRLSVGVLGFAIAWEHRFEPGLPLFMRISRDGCLRHLSEHPGARTR